MTSDELFMGPFSAMMISAGRLKQESKLDSKNPTPEGPALVTCSSLQT
jgi:hypothetical protein